MDCQKGKKEKSTGTLRCLSHASDLLGFGVWQSPIQIKVLKYFSKFHITYRTLNDCKFDRKSGTGPVKLLFDRSLKWAIQLKIYYCNNKWRLNIGPFYPLTWKLIDCVWFRYLQVLYHCEIGYVRSTLPSQSTWWQVPN